MEKKFFLPEFNYEVTIGKYAGQADGAVWFKCGGTVILATVCSASSGKFPGFFPLTTDYREHLAAAGKIPGGYFKREGKPSDKEVLTSRLIDRALRPLFPSYYFDQLQVIATVYSVDKEHAPYTMSLVASSLALSISKIPFLGPVGAVEVIRVNGKWIVNPLYTESLNSNTKIIVAGTEEGINMVEARAEELTEPEFLDALFLAHEVIKKQVIWQKGIVQDLNIEKESLKDKYGFSSIQDIADKFLTDNKVASLQVDDKVVRGEIMSALKTDFLKLFKPLSDQDLGEALTAVKKTILGEYKAETGSEELADNLIEYVFDEVLETKLTDMIFKTNKRIDGRLFDQVRKISNDVGLLPFNHGSALFQRGRTQALVSVTLGGGQDEQKIEDLMQDEVVERSFMLHYNFLPFSTGEVKSLRGTGRREIGHGYLALSALKAVMPSPDKFPYTVRIVSDILESDGSSSMATVCGGTMALMNAGVPIKSMVGGIAMGLLQSSTGEFQVLSDISGIEDAFGLMDFKVAGTDKGATAIQMDIKYKGGLSRELLERAFKQAYIGRLHILGEMRKELSVPNPTLSPLVPQITSFKIPNNKIGAIIGTGGKTIREITEKTGTTIDIEEDGTVKIFGHPGPKLEQAILWVKTLGGLIEAGSVYTGKIKKIAEFGVFVELAPGSDGLVHVSNMPKSLQANFMNKLKIDEFVKVSVVDYDESTGRVRLRLID